MPLTAAMRWNYDEKRQGGQDECKYRGHKDYQSEKHQQPSSGDYGGEDKTMLVTAMLLTLGR